MLKAAYLLLGRPHPRHAFFEKAEFQFLVRHDLLQITGFPAQVSHFVSCGSTRRTACLTPLAGLHEVLRPFVIYALRNTLTAAQIINAVLAAQAVQHDPDLHFGGILLPRGALDVVDDLLARALGCRSHRPFLGGHNEPETLSFQIALFGPVSAAVRHKHDIVSRRIPMVAGKSVMFRKIGLSGLSAALKVPSAAATGRGTRIEIRVLSGISMKR